MKDAKVETFAVLRIRQAALTAMHAAIKTDLFRAEKVFLAMQIT